jgi:spore coat polysaccharide biosynthesis predicted glycosyltransferase SpsG
MTREVIILTEGGAKIGLGHITRCLALYEAFKEYDLEPTLIVSGDTKAEEFLQRQKVQYKIENWLEKVNSIRDSILIIDSYLAPAGVYSTLRKNKNIVVAIDDYNRLQYDAHIVVSPTIYGEFLDYKKRPDTIYLLGPRYIILRKEFWDVPTKKINNDIKNVMITFGGDDLRNLTPRVLNLLKDIPYTFHVVIGRAFNDTSYIPKYRKYPNIKFYFDLGAKEILRLMLISDVAISGCGQTLHELAKVGVPTIGVVVAENQKLNARYFQKLGFIMYAGKYNESSLDRNILKMLEILSDYNERKHRSEIGRKLIDGLGARRIVSEVVTYENSLNK